MECRLTSWQGVGSCALPAPILVFHSLQFLAARSPRRKLASSSAWKRGAASRDNLRMSTRHTLTESSSFTAQRIDREAGVIRGVLLCGAESKNGRRYSPNVFRKELYEGKSVYLNHSTTSRGDRPLEGKLGWISNVQIRNGKPFGDLHLIKSHPQYGPIIELAERAPNQLGLSHVCHAATRWIDGYETVESIGRVDSVDLVAEPATTKGLFESHRMNSIRNVCSRLRSRKAKQLRRLCEAAGLGDAQVPGGESAGVLDGLKVAANAILGEVFAGTRTVEEGLKLIRKIVQLADPMGGADDALDDPMEPDDDFGPGEMVGAGAGVTEESWGAKQRRAIRESLAEVDLDDPEAFRRWFNNEPDPAAAAAFRAKVTSSTTPPPVRDGGVWRPIFGKR